MRRCLEGLQKIRGGLDLPLSVRAICCLAMCPSPGTNPLEPLTWPKDCCLGECTACPELTVTLPADPETPCNFLQWRKGYVAGKKDRAGEEKEIFSLFPMTMSAEEAASLLISMMDRMKEHVFTAAHQYEALR